MLEKIFLKSYDSTHCGHQRMMSLTYRLDKPSCGLHLFFDKFFGALFSFRFSIITHHMFPHRLVLRRNSLSRSVPLVHTDEKAPLICFVSRISVFVIDFKIWLNIVRYFQIGPHFFPWPWILALD